MPSLTQGDDGYSRHAQRTGRCSSGVGCRPMAYQPDPLKAPTLSGMPFRALVGALESPLGLPLVKKLMADMGYQRFRAAQPGPHASPIQLPLTTSEGVAIEPAPARDLAAFAASQPVVATGAKLETVSAFVAAYTSGTTDPVRVARRVHENIERLDSRDEKMSFFIARKPEQVMAAAEASLERHRAGRTLSVLDGVPVVIKDELDMEGFPTTLGTRVLTTPARADATVVARLKAAGAVILGKANMNEIGISPFGINPHYGTVRNPWNRRHHTGGSSSGPAATVAAGLCPLAIGADGGGSIRIPSALCGVVGLKATFGRISEAGVPPLCWNVGHVGPIGLTVADVAIGYSLVAGPDRGDAVSLAQPALHLADFSERSLTGVRLGICTPFFEDAQPDVVKACLEAVRALQEAGATVVEAPAPDLNTIRWMHSVIIVSEMRAAMGPWLDEDSTRFSLATRQNLAIGAQFSGADLVHAMRHRNALTRQYLELMKTCDVVVTPSTATAAPELPESALPEGESNLRLLDEVMRFARIGNLTGFPALTVPAGFNGAGMPVGVQLMGRPWEEHTLFRLGRVIEAAVQRRTPQVHATALE